MSEATAIEPRRKHIPAFSAWLVCTVVLAAAVLVALVLLLLREPEMIVRDGPVPPASPPTEEMLAEAERHDVAAEATSKELRAVLHDVLVYECPAGTAPSNPKRFGEIRRQSG